MFDHINSNPEFNAELKFGTLEDYFTELRKQSAVSINYLLFLPAANGLADQGIT